MSSQLARKFTTLALVLSLLSGTFAVAAAPQQAQTQQPTATQPATQTAPDKQDKDKKDKKAKPDEPTANGTATTTAANNDPKRPLSVDEDPAMIGKRNINHGIWAKMAGSLDKEVAQGRQLAAEVDREAKFIDDPMVTEYVNRVGQNIVLHSDAKVPFTIKVIDTDEVNAFALPGGFFYVHKGLILAADNEAELAGVMAHEIAHVAARHAMENQRKMELMQGAAIVGSIFLGGIPGLILNNAGGFFEGMAFLKFSRAAEEEADRLGVQYMWAAGYDPNAMATMFEKLEAKNKKKPGSIAKLFMDHPAPADRRASAIALAARFPERDEYIISTSEFQR